MLCTNYLSWYTNNLCRYQPQHVSQNARVWFDQQHKYVLTLLTWRWRIKRRRYKKVDVESTCFTRLLLKYCWTTLWPLTRSTIHLSSYTNTYRRNHQTVLTENGTRSIRPAERVRTSLTVIPQFVGDSCSHLWICLARTLSDRLFILGVGFLLVLDSISCQPRQPWNTTWTYRNNNTSMMRCAHSLLTNRRIRASRRRCSSVAAVSLAFQLRWSSTIVSTFVGLYCRTTSAFHSCGIQKGQHVDAQMPGLPWNKWSTA